jgi:hypothetical protein
LGLLQALVAENQLILKIRGCSSVGSWGNDFVKLGWAWVAWLH